MDQRSAVAVVGLAAAFPGAEGIEEFWVRLMTGAGPPIPGAVAVRLPAPTLPEIVAAAIGDAGHDPDAATPFGGKRVSVVPTVACAMRELRTGACGVAVVADDDPSGAGAGAAVLRPHADAIADRDDIRALLREPPTAPDAVQIDVPHPGGTAALLIGVLALEREIRPVAGRSPVAWPREPGRIRAATVDALAGAVLEEAPPHSLTPHDGRPRVLVWSADTADEERTVRSRIAQLLVARGEAAFADVTATLQGRSSAGRVRAAAVCTAALDAAGVLGAVRDSRVIVAPPGPAGPLGLLFRGRRRAAARTRSVPAPAFAPAFTEALRPWLDALGRSGPVGEEARAAAVEAAAARAWTAAGVRPATLVASGAGVTAAAVAADALDPPTAVRLLAARHAVDPVAAVVRALDGGAVRSPAVPLRSGDGRELSITDPACWLAPDGPTPDPVAAGVELLVDSYVDGEAALLEGAARMWTAGHDVDWRVLGQAPLARRTPLPRPRPHLTDAPATCAGARRRAVPGTPAERWIEVLGEPAGTTVLALPYAGGAGRAFRPLRRFLPAQCALAVVDLPGHGRLMDRPCPTAVEDVLGGLQEAVAALPPTRLVLLGYSMGGSFAYELATRMSAAGDPPVGLIVCGTRAPHTGVGHPPVAQHPAGVPFLTAATAMQLAAREMVEMPELAAVFAAPLHADLAMVESLPFRPRPPLPVPACVVGFRSDWLVPEPSLRAWDGLLADPPRHLRIDGGHLALHEREDAFGAVIATALVHLLAARRQQAGLRPAIP
jgi:surfactin synthase thioesterase subunit